MLTRAQEKLIRSLHTKKGRDVSGLCLVEGEKAIEAAGSAVVFTFGSKDTPNFHRLVTTETPQPRAAVARIPVWSDSDITARDIIVVLDGVQDPGNVGAIQRACLGFDASLVLVDAADPTSPKVVRSSAGSIFSVPWQSLSRVRATDAIRGYGRPVYRLEKRKGARAFQAAQVEKPCVCIAGSEGSGIQLAVPGTSLFLPHSKSLESLNVGHALSIFLFCIRQ